MQYIALVAMVAVLLTGCDGGNNRFVVMSEFQLTVTNLTNAQPLSPTAAVAHRDAFAVFNIGQPVSAGLEELAESGANTAFLNEAAGDPNVLATTSGFGVIGPGNSEVVTVTVPTLELQNARLSISTMLVNTNDAITGINGLSLAGLSVGDVMRIQGNAYDAGTEADTELGSDIPGPAGGGEGFNAARDDSFDRVTLHQGVVTSDDGLITSILTGQHRFDNPVIQIQIERIN